MTTLPTYNGWTNYPTWNVALWIGNDPGLDETLREMARDEIARGDSANAYNLAARIKDWMQELMVPEGAGPAQDVIGWALGYVDWDSIAEHALDDEQDS